MNNTDRTTITAALMHAAREELAQAIVTCMIEENVTLDGAKEIIAAHILAEKPEWLTEEQEEEAHRMIDLGYSDALKMVEYSCQIADASRGVKNGAR